MAIAFTAGTSVEGTASATSTVVTLPSGLASGDYTIIFVSCNATNSTITTPSGWTDILADTNSVNGSTSMSHAIFYRKWVAGDGNVTVTHSNGRVAATPVKVSGADLTTFVNTASTVTQAATGATTIIAPTITPSSTVLVSVFTGRRATNGTFLTPFSSLSGTMTQIAEANGKATGATNAGHLIAYEIVTANSATGTRQANPAGSTTGAFGVSFALNEAAGGPPPPPTIETNLETFESGLGIWTPTTAGSGTTSRSTTDTHQSVMGIGASVPATSVDIAGFSTTFTGVQQVAIEGWWKVSSEGILDSNVPFCRWDWGNTRVADIYRQNQIPTGFNLWLRVPKATTGSWFIPLNKRLELNEWIYIKAVWGMDGIPHVWLNGVQHLDANDAPADYLVTTTINKVWLGSPEAGNQGVWSMDNVTLTTISTPITPPLGAGGYGQFTGSGTTSLTQTGMTVSAPGTLTGSGTLSTTRTLTASGIAGLTGSGTLSSVRTVAFTRASGLSGSGTLSASGIALITATGTATFTGSGTLSTTRTLTATGSAGLTGSGTLTASGVSVITGTGNFTSSGTLSSTRTLTASGSAGLTGSGTVTTVRTLTASGAASLSSAGALSSTRVASTVQAASLSGAGTLTATGIASATSTANFTGSGTLSSSGNTATNGTGSLTGSGTLSASGVAFPEQGNIYNLFTGTPQIGADSDTGSVNLGTEFYVTASAWVTQIRYLQPATGGTSTSRVGMIYSTTDGNTGTLVAGPFTIPAPTAGTWGTYTLPTALQLTANTRYRVVIRHPDGRYAATGGYFNDGAGQTTLTQGILVRPNRTNTLATDQGSYLYSESNAFPTESFNGASYYSDITVTDVNPNGNDHSGEFSQTATGTLSAVGNSSVSGSAAFTGVGSLTSTRIASASASAELSGSGSVSAVRLVGFNDTANVSGTGTLSSAVVIGFAQAFNFQQTATGTLSTSQIVAFTGSNSLSGSGTLSTTRTLNTSSSANLSGSGTLSRSSSFDIKQTGNHTSTGTLSVSNIQVSHSVSANFTGSGTLNSFTEGTGSGSFTAQATGTLSAVATNVTHSSPAGFSSTGTLSTAANIATSRSASITATGSLSTTNSQADFQKAVTLTADGQISVSTSITFSQTSGLVATGVLTTISIPGQDIAVEFSSGATLSVEASASIETVAELSSTGQLSASGSSGSNAALFAATGLLSVVTSATIGPRTRETFVITLESKTYNGSIESDQYVGLLNPPMKEQTEVYSGILNPNQYIGFLSPQSKYSATLNPSKKVN